MTTPELRADTFDSTNPASGAVVGTFAVCDTEDVADAVSRARHASARWRGLGFDGRRRRLEAYKRTLARRADELCEVVHAETGKPLADAFLEVLLAVDHLAWAARHAERLLRLRRVRTSALLFNHAAYVEYRPVGVVGVIGPWNYPVHTPMGSISYALAAGNTVVFKPSEHTPATATWLADAFADATGDAAVFQVVTGFGATGEALCRAGVDVLAFTGSSATARKVMAACAEVLTKVVMECGGNDALIVDADADLDAAAAAAVWGGCANAGQTCAGVERVYAVDAVYERFLGKVVDAAAALRVGAGADADVGPISMPGQVDVIEEHLRDAFARGARALVGGLDSVRRPFVEPVVLTDVPSDARILREETFGPVLPVVRVADADEAVAHANDSTYGLGASVYSRARGVELARRLDVGMVSVNSVLSYAAIPALPFGGVRESGFGRIHGEDGLKEFTTPRAITRERFGLPFALTSFDRPRQLVPVLRQVLRLRHGR
jgi:acyl-CoA reductase-like NAD-dependent aldehyde dehydrogenase